MTRDGSETRLTKKGSDGKALLYSLPSFRVIKLPIQCTIDLKTGNTEQGKCPYTNELLFVNGFKLVFDV